MDEGEKDDIVSSINQLQPHSLINTRVNIFAYPVKFIFLETYQLPLVQSKLTYIDLYFALHYFRRRFWQCLQIHTHPMFCTVNEKTVCNACNVLAVFTLS